ncbi:tyrosine-type recombinase/integrase [Streptomyces aidingensis]|uniref:Site-specific recombinase XerD n=1 Tax=Streptomyces aidingensis TaxID=910347 RepID=A0A1I1GQ11_9ACTN|nr:site-specific integrase [Streptomyces aidingensis]SFC11978.1 Site-specific recombinase XerD [Streptomyces aidingensis]
MARAWVARSKDDPKKWTTFWYDPDGKQRQKSFSTKTRADDHRKRKEQELDAGTYLDDRLGKQTVVAVWEQWFNQRKLTNSTKKQYRSILNTTIKPFFRARTIVSLKVADIEKWLLWMEEEAGLAARTRRQRFSYFSGMMDWAVVNEIIGRNPCKKVKGAGSRAKEIREYKNKARRLTTREVLAILDGAPPRYRAMLWLMAGCGLRLGEAMAVARDQIDFKGETLRVDFQITEDGETDSGKNSAIQRRHIKARDAEEPGRTVPLPPNVAFELRRHLKNHGTWGPERLLFPNVTRSGYLYASYFYRQIWMVSLTKAALDYCKPHAVRHYYGSRLLYAGVPENDVADWMGHSSTDVLREHYHYIFEGAEERGRSAIASMLSPGADDPGAAGSEVA